MSQLELEILLTAAIILAIYWFVVRPRIEKGGRKRDLEQLQVGDEVLTTSGFLGTVKDIYIPESGPVQIVIDFGNGVVVNALSSAIAQRVAAGQTIHSRSLEHSEEAAGD
jgi:preprotein translocase YajC subunit